MESGAEIVLNSLLRPVKGPNLCEEGPRGLQLSARVHQNHPLSDPTALLQPLASEVTELHLD